MKNDRSMYSVHPTVSYVATMLRNLPDRTGRTLAEWKNVISAGGPTGQKEIVVWLKSNHDLGGTTANLVAGAATGQDPEKYDEDHYLTMAVDFVSTMYNGKKSHLRPMHDVLISRIAELGDDVRLSPTKTFVPAYRNRVFAQIKPATLSRIDVGFALKGYTDVLPDRLIATDGLKKGDRITHRIPVAAVAEIDSELDRWLHVAYSLDGK